MDGDVVFIFNPAPSTRSPGLLHCGELLNIEEQVWVQRGAKEMLELVGAKLGLG